LTPEIDGRFAVSELNLGEPVVSGGAFTWTLQILELAGENDVLGENQFVQPEVRFLFSEMDDQSGFVGPGLFHLLVASVAEGNAGVDPEIHIVAVFLLLERVHVAMALLERYFVIPHTGLGEEFDQLVDVLEVGLEIEVLAAVHPDGVNAGFVAGQRDNALGPINLFNGGVFVGTVGADSRSCHAVGGWVPQQNTDYGEKIWERSHGR